MAIRGDLFSSASATLDRRKLLQQQAEQKEVDEASQARDNTVNGVNQVAQTIAQARNLGRDSNDPSLQALGQAATSTVQRSLDAGFIDELEAQNLIQTIDLSFSAKTQAEIDAAEVEQKAAIAGAEKTAEIEATPEDPAQPELRTIGNQVIQITPREDGGVDTEVIFPVRRAKAHQNRKPSLIRTRG